MQKPAKYHIVNAKVVNEGEVFLGEVFIENQRIRQVANIAAGDLALATDPEAIRIDARGQLLLPGIIDDQVHFRDPGLTHKADLYTESRAAVAGGITSYMEMPNTVPNTLTQDLLEQKYAMAAQKSLANYSFYMGVSNDNLDEVLATDPRKVCGLKLFMGSSTGNMLVDNEETLNRLFASTDMLIAVHSEDEGIIQANTKKIRDEYGETPPFSIHPVLRSDEACYTCTERAIRLAKKHGARLHILHLSTAREMALFDNQLPLEQKKITAEVCVHHLWFDASQYETHGARIKWNPAVKYATDREALFAALLDDRLDVIATDHAPHTLEEKENTYFKAPSGGPLVQHSLLTMLEFWRQNKISLERVVEKMCHAPARLFGVQNRGFIRPGYAADLVLVNPEVSWKVQPDNILYKCGWSPFEGETFHSQVTHTFVNGHLVYENGQFEESVKGQRLQFNRD